MAAAIEQGGCCQQHLLNRVAKLPKTFCPFSMFDPWPKKAQKAPTCTTLKSLITGSVMLNFPMINVCIVCMDLPPLKVN